MGEASRKFIFYGAFATLGIFWAEVISTNIPYALINPLAYPLYGLLYVFFIDALMRWDGRDIKVMFLYGALVGLITETYAAKVTFFGPMLGEYQILGVAPFSIMFIILFFHSFFSFLAPVYLARRVLKMPMPVTQKKWKDMLILLVPFVMLPIVSITLTNKGMTAWFLMQWVGISSIILFAWILLLRHQKEIKNVLLSKKERKALLIVTLVSYLIFTIWFANPGHGHAPLDFPPIPMIVVTAIILGLLLLCQKALSKGKKEKEAVPYSPGSIDLRLFLAWLLWQFSVTAVLLLFQDFIKPLFALWLITFGLIGSAIGVLMLIYSVSLLGKRAIMAGKR